MRQKAYKVNLCTLCAENPHSSRISALHHRKDLQENMTAGHPRGCPAVFSVSYCIDQLLVPCQ